MKQDFLITNFDMPVSHLIRTEYTKSKELIVIISRLMGIDIMYHTRKKEYVFGRNLVAWYMRRHQQVKVELIAEIMGWANHSSLYNAMRRIDNIIFTKDKEFYPYVETFLKLVG